MIMFNNCIINLVMYSIIILNDHTMKYRLIKDIKIKSTDKVSWTRFSWAENIQLFRRPLLY